MNKSLDKKPVNVQSTEKLLDIILHVLDGDNHDRKIVAIVGPPGSGKSTLMSELLPRLKSKIGDEAVTGIPMDGFHLDNAQLNADNTRKVKGAPHTFDVGGLLSLVERIAQAGREQDASADSKAPSQSELKYAQPIYAPEFDRANDASRNCVLKIDHKHKLVLIEGNYLLLDKPIWRELKKHFALTLSIDVSAETIKERLVNRWLYYGLSENDALKKALSNDLPNAKTVIEQSMAADIIFTPENLE